MAAMSGSGGGGAGAGAGGCSGPFCAAMATLSGSVPSSGGKKLFTHRFTVLILSVSNKRR